MATNREWSLMAPLRYFTVEKNCLNTFFLISLYSMTSPELLIDSKMQFACLLVLPTLNTYSWKTPLETQKVAILCPIFPVFSNSAEYDYGRI